MNAASFFTKEQQAEILASIKEAERSTSGEIRIHIQNTCDEDVLDRAAWIFNKLNMHKTSERNGVLFFLALHERKFAIIGDAGINSKVPRDFWDEIKELLQNSFREEKFTEGLSGAILLAGSQLKAHFPSNKDDVNELSDEISFD
jgi:uncharacterized membrane protein